MILVLARAKGLLAVRTHLLSVKKQLPEKDGTTGQVQSAHRHLWGDNLVLGFPCAIPQPALQV